MSIFQNSFLGLFSSNNSKIAEKQQIQQQVAENFLLDKNQQGLSYIQIKFLSLNLSEKFSQNSKELNKQIQFQTMGEKWLYKLNEEKSFILQNQSNQRSVLAKIHYFKFNSNSQQILYIRLKNLNTQIVLPLKKFIANQIINEIQADLYPRDKSAKRESIGKIRFEVLFLKNVWLEVSIKLAQVSSSFENQRQKNSKLFMRILQKEKNLYKPIKLNTRSPHILKLGLTQHSLYSIEFALQFQQQLKQSKKVTKLNFQNLNLLSNNSSHKKIIQLPSSEEVSKKQMQMQIKKVFQILYECKIVKKQSFNLNKQGSLIEDL